MDNAAYLSIFNAIKADFITDRYGKLNYLSQIKTLCLFQKGLFIEFQNGYAGCAQLYHNSIWTDITNNLYKNEKYMNVLKIVPAVQFLTLRAVVYIVTHSIVMIISYFKT